ncbi:hypothetical protein AOLI_G00056020 [Acnodon oligacanthus]
MRVKRRGKCHISYWRYRREDVELRFSQQELGVRPVQDQTVWAGSYSSYRSEQSSSSVSIGQTPRAITLAPGGADGWLAQSEPSGHKAQEMVQNMAALFRGSGPLDIVLNGRSGKLRDFMAYKSQRCVDTKASKHRKP